MLCLIEFRSINWNVFQACARFHSYKCSKHKILHARNVKSLVACVRKPSCFPCNFLHNFQCECLIPKKSYMNFLCFTCFDVFVLILRMCFVSMFQNFLKLSVFFKILKFYIYDPHIWTLRLHTIIIYRVEKWSNKVAILTGDFF